jgi:hypothetical protein
MKTLKYICTFDQFRATVILDILVALLCLSMAVLLLWQAQMGYVSRRLVHNPQTEQMEKVIPNPDLPWESLYPRRFASLRLPWNILCIVNGIFAASLLGCSITQSTGQLIQPPGYNKPIFNDGYNWPRDLYVIGGEEAFRYGSWPEANFLLRLSANVVSVVTLAFAIQWRNDGRLMQLVVMIASLLGGALYLTAFHWDYIEISTAHDGGCYPSANGNQCIYMRYIVMLVFDMINGTFLILFNVRNLWVWFIQARNPIEQEHVAYGWWFFGEWQAKAEEQAKDKREELARAAKLKKEKEEAEWEAAGRAAAPFGEGGEAAAQESDQ